MSYYQEGQAGLGQIIGGGTLLSSGLTLNKSQAPSTSNTSRVNVGIDPAVVAALGALLAAGGGALATSDAARVPMILAGASLKGMKPNQWGKIDPTAVMNALNIMSPTAQAFVTQMLTLGATPGMLDGQPYADAVASVRALGITSLAAFMSDITAGKYAGTLPTVSVKLSPSIMASAALKTQVAATAVANAQTKQAVADQAAQNFAATQAAADAAAAQQAQAQADAAAAAAAAATQAAAAATAQAAQQTDGGVGPSDLVVTDPTTGLPATTTTTTHSGSSFPWLYVGIGAAGLAVVGWVLMSRKSSTPNRSRRSKKNRGRRARRVRKV